MIDFMKRLVALLTFSVVFTGSMIFHKISTLPGNLHGDEIHYLVITSSLLNDGDLDVQNNYSSQELRPLGVTHVTPHLIYSASGRAISSHEPGLPALLTLPFFLGGRHGVILFLTLLSSFAAMQVYFLALHFGVTRWKAALATLITAFNLPFIMISGKVFPDSIAALFLPLAFRWMLLDRRFSRFVAGSILLALLPWMHIKFTFFTVIILLIFLFKRCYTFKQLLFVLSPLLISGIGFIRLQYSLFGELFYVLRVKAGGFGNPLTGMLGLLFDREAGLMVFAPVLMLAFCGLLFRWKRSCYLNIAAVIVILFWIISGSWIDWHSGHCPPARYLIPLLPFLGLFLALELSAPQSARTLLLSLFLWSVTVLQIAGVLLTVPEMAIVHTDGINRLWHHFLPASLEHAAPSLLNPTPGTTWSMIGALLLFSSCCAAMFFPGDSLRLLSILVAVFVVISAGVIGIGINLERNYHRNLAEMPLPDYGPHLISPADGTAWWGRFPDLEWGAVPGADGYLYVIEFPDGQTLSVPKYGSTQVLITEGIAETLSVGKYCWYVVPLKQGTRGVASEKACFELF